MYCPNCGVNLPDNIRFCTTCGFKLNIPQSMRQNASSQSPSVIMDEVKPRQSVDFPQTSSADANPVRPTAKKAIFSSKSGLIIPIVVIVSIVLLIAAVVVFTTPEKQYTLNVPNGDYVYDHYYSHSEYQPVSHEVVTISFFNNIPSGNQSFSETFYIVTNAIKEKNAHLVVDNKPTGTHYTITINHREYRIIVNEDGLLFGLSYGAGSGGYSFYLKDRNN
ncbi:MAG: zinc ribbon domain-containing protein [Candidatus Methanomethylophilaceae archaeon]|nr:zinc ribbon domain-containing protein [Candidatus Methanomethylophilaceae archaeon]